MVSERVTGILVEVVSRTCREDEGSQNDGNARSAGRGQVDAVERGLSCDRAGPVIRPEHHDIGKIGDNDVLVWDAMVEVCEEVDDRGRRPTPPASERGSGPVAGSQ